jgi:hypothetical protein
MGTLSFSPKLGAALRPLHFVRELTAYTAEEQPLCVVAVIGEEFFINVFSRCATLLTGQSLPVLIALDETVIHGR